jgi:hypothetical protein
MVWNNKEDYDDVMNALIKFKEGLLLRGNPQYWQYVEFLKNIDTQLTSILQSYFLSGQIKEAEAIELDKTLSANFTKKSAWVRTFWANSARLRK